MLLIIFKAVLFLTSSSHIGSIKITPRRKKNLIMVCKPTHTIAELKIMATVTSIPVESKDHYRQIII